MLRGEIANLRRSETPNAPWAIKGTAQIRVEIHGKAEQLRTTRLSLAKSSDGGKSTKFIDSTEV